MDAVSADMVAQSIEAMNQIIKGAQQQQLDLAKEMVQITAELKVASVVQDGKGGAVDMYA